MFITIEGGEGSGKSTLIKKLQNELTSKGLEVIVTHEPGGSKLGQHIRNWLLNNKSDTHIGKRAELMLFLADRVQHIEEVILPALNLGKIVISDRFNDSTVAYQGSGRSMGIDEVQELCDLVCEGLTPDITIFLDIDPEIGLKRLQAEPDRLESEKIEFHQRVRQGFHALVRQDPDRFSIIDATKPADTVFSEAIQKIESHLNETRN